MQLLNDEINNPSTVCRLRLPMVFPGTTFRFLCEHQLAQFAHQSGNKNDYGYRSEKIRSAFY